VKKKIQRTKNNFRHASTKYSI